MKAILFALFLLFVSSTAGADCSQLPAGVPCTDAERVALEIDATVKSLQEHADDGDLGARTFDEIESGTNTSAAMVVGTGGSLSASGSGTIGATTAGAFAADPSDCVANQCPIGINASGAAQSCKPLNFATVFENDIGDYAPPSRMYFSGDDIVMDSAETYVVTAAIIADANLPAFDGDHAHFGAICEGAPAGAWQHTTNSCMEFNPTDGWWFLDEDEDGNYDNGEKGIGLLQRMPIWNYWWHDADNDGTHDPGEPTLGVGPLNTDPITFVYYLSPKTSDYTVDSFVDSESSGVFFTNDGATGTVTFTLSAPEAGKRVYFAVAEAQWLDIDPEDTGDQILRLTDSGGDKLGSNTVGSVVELIGINTTQWVARESGSWADRN